MPAQLSRAIVGRVSMLGEVVYATNARGSEENTYHTQVEGICWGNAARLFGV